MVHPETVFKTMSWTAQLVVVPAKRSLLRIQELHRRLLHIVGPEQHKIRPHSYTVVWSLVAFVVFVVLTSVAVKATTPAMRISFACVSCGLFVVLAEIIIADFAFDSTSVPLSAVSLMGYSLF